MNETPQKTFFSASAVATPCAHEIRNARSIMYENTAKPLFPDMRIGAPSEYF